MDRLPLDFVSCVDCGHVFNSRFDYQAVPYSDKPNLMYNRGSAWKNFLGRVRERVIRRLPENPVVVEIGYGDGDFLFALAKAAPRGRYLGFDPHGSHRESGPEIELRRCLFDPWTHLSELKPDLIISRHVLEHLTNPLGFVQSMSFASTSAGLRPLLYLEVPCIDRALASGRVADFYYEHNSHFTTSSFLRMIERSYGHLDTLEHGYGGEVVYAFIRAERRLEHVERAKRATGFRTAVERRRRAIRRQVSAIYASGKKTAIWGGTGKSAAFIHAYSLDAARFPLVVDSDPLKVGSYVPGTGQEIRAHGTLRDSPVEIIVIPCSWRARDIVSQIKEGGIPFGQILVEHDGELVDYFSASHPYARVEPVTVDAA